MRLLRVVLVNGALSAAVIFLVCFAFEIDRQWPHVLPDGLRLVGWPLLGAGTLLILAAEASFIRAARATGATGDAPARLVTTGPFRCVRNPIYIGAAVTLFGVAFLRRSPTLTLAAVVTIPVIGAYVRWIEEPRLERRFGDQYRRYRRAVPKWVPNCWKSVRSQEEQDFARG